MKILVKDKKKLQCCKRRVIMIRIKRDKQTGGGEGEKMTI